jgi:hypothetical protein
MLYKLTWKVMTLHHLNFRDSNVKIFIGGNMIEFVQWLIKSINQIIIYISNQFQDLTKYTLDFQYYKDYSNSRETDNLFGEKKQSYTVILHLIVLKKCKKLDYLSYQIELMKILTF